MSEKPIRIKEIFSLTVLTAVYLIFHYRYMPGDISKSVIETVFQLLTTAPLAVGFTILLVSFLQRMHDEKVPWDRIIRLYLTFGIIIGFLFALNEYWERGAKGL